MDNPQRRHDISDGAWALIEPHLPGQRGQWGGIAKDNRLFINAVFGFYALEHHGAICRLNTANGEQSISDSFAGEINGFGKDCLKY